jgi:hypothetical protein
VFSIWYFKFDFQSILALIRVFFLSNFRISMIVAATFVGSTDFHTSWTICWCSLHISEFWFMHVFNFSHLNDYFCNTLLPSSFYICKIRKVLRIRNLLKIRAHLVTVYFHRWLLHLHSTNLFYQYQSIWSLWDLTIWIYMFSFNQFKMLLALKSNG